MLPLAITKSIWFVFRFCMEKSHYIKRAHKLFSPSTAELFTMPFLRHLIIVLFYLYFLFGCNHTTPHSIVEQVAF